MASADSPASSSTGPPPPRTIRDADPITRNALRYTISAREYELLHQYLLSRTPALKHRAPLPATETASPAAEEVDYNAATIRISLRLFLATYSGLKLWDFASQRLLARGQAVASKARDAFWRSPNFRLSLSLSSILLFHRLLHRFFLRLRESLRGDDARPFRKRNPRVSRALTSKVAPAVGASLAGLALGISPADQTRITITIYVLSRSLEYLYNSLPEHGIIKGNRPWWFGSWLLMPLSCGQLLHAFVFDRECFPAAYGNFIMKRSPEYIQQRPADRPAHLPWPSTNEIVDALAHISELKWPAFISPILFPATNTLPSARLTPIRPVTSPAHPSIKNLSCAVLHPQDPSCSRTFLQYYLRAFPQTAKFFALFYGALALPRYKAFLKAPTTFVNTTASGVLKTTVFLTNAIGTAWASICLMQHFLPGHVLPTGRWFFGGFFAGMWAFIARKDGRGNALYSARMSADSLWKVGKKRGWWKGVKNGDILLFVFSLMLIDVIYERHPTAVQGGVIRKAMGMLRGDGWVDRAPGAKKEKGNGKEKEREARGEASSIGDKELR